VQLLRLSTRMSITSKAGRAMDALHTELRAAHFDVKPENMLVDGVGAEPDVVLCDLGFAQTEASLRAIQAEGGMYYPVSQGLGGMQVTSAGAVLGGAGCCWQPVAAGLMYGTQNIGCTTPHALC
jgi:serine/threonine protein kinase